MTNQPVVPRFDDGGVMTVGDFPYENICVSPTPIVVGSWFVKVKVGAHNSDS